MIRSTTSLAALAALVASLSLVDTAEAQFSFSLGTSGGSSFGMSIGRPAGGFIAGRRPVQQVGGWVQTPAIQTQTVRFGRRGRLRRGPVVVSTPVQPAGWTTSRMMPTTPMMMPAPQMMPVAPMQVPMPMQPTQIGPTQFVGMPTHGVGFSQPSFGGLAQPVGLMP